MVSSVLLLFECVILIEIVSSIPDMQKKFTYMPEACLECIIKCVVIANNERQHALITDI
jgi:hypothetical protein